MFAGSKVYFDPALITSSLNSTGYVLDLVLAITCLDNSRDHDYTFNVELRELSGR